MNNASAGNMIVDALKKLFLQLLKLIALIIAFFIETGGKILMWTANQIKQAAK